MQVIFGKEQKNILGDKYTILELDTFMQDGLAEPITTYAVLGVEDINITELPTLDNFTRMHNAMLKEYKEQNWNFCHQALEHLKGKWGKQLDSFYDVFEQRISNLEKDNLPSDWNGVIYKSALELGNS